MHTKVGQIVSNNGGFKDETAQIQESTRSVHARTSIKISVRATPDCRSKEEDIPLMMIGENEDKKIDDSPIIMDEDTRIALRGGRLNVNSGSDVQHEVTDSVLDARLFSDEIDERASVLTTSIPLKDSHNDWERARKTQVHIGSGSTFINRVDPIIRTTNDVAIFSGVAVAIQILEGKTAAIADYCRMQIDVW